MSFLAQFLLLFLLTYYADSTYSEVHYITPSLDSPCPQYASPCITLSQFAANSSDNETNVSLLFLPGHHTLDQELLLAHGHNFSMSKCAKDNETVFVKCISQLGRFDISEITSVSIKGLYFIGCSSNRVSQVIWLTIADSSFQGVQDESTVLEISKVINTTIVRSQFLNNTLQSYYNDIILKLYLLIHDPIEFLDVLYHKRNTSSRVLHLVFSNVSVVSCRFINNIADLGGALVAHNSSVHIDKSTLSYNTAIYGGAMVTSESTVDVNNSIFTHNSAEVGGGVMVTHNKDRVRISSSSFSDNIAVEFIGGVMMAFGDSSFNISNSNFTSNSAGFLGGAIYTYRDSITISNSNFTSNRARYGGAVYTRGDSSFTISSSNFISNSARFNESDGILIYCRGATLSIDSSNFSSNAISTNGRGLIFINHCSTNIANITFDDNVGSIYTFNSNLNFSGNSKFKNSTVSELLIAENESQRQEGGVISSFQSTVKFINGSTTHFSNNLARDGGTIFAIESTILINGETTIANNNITTIANSSGGGIFLKQSRFEIRGKCNLVNNSAVRGGGIHATSSTIAVYQPGSLQLISNNAKFGGGIYLDVNSKLYVLKTREMTDSNQRLYFMDFIGNHANYGGAVYVADDTNSGSCSLNHECFIQTLALYQFPLNHDTVNIFFSENTATEKGANLFGGLLDRCIPSPFAEVYYENQNVHYNGITYLQNITKNAQIHSISSQPVRVCFCNIEHEPDCSYQLPTITVKKGEAFNVSVVAVDQVNNTVDANITTSISSSDGGFGEGQHTQSVGRNCTDLTYNVFSPHDHETINLFADGPCRDAALSTSVVSIYFNECTCPVGFVALKLSTRCECICDPSLSDYITGFYLTTSVVFKSYSNTWITYINNSDSPDYVIYPHCPFDYCKLPKINETVSINFNLPNGADAQCAYNRTGVLCGSCIEKLSLSLASSRCLPCHSYWPAVCIVILLDAILAGILLVTALLTLNMTVSVGLINVFIFYANIVSAGSAVFFPSSEPSFPSIFVAWLNLEIGIDVCFINGLDAYIKTWLQLAFPLYIIFLVVMVIIVSEYSPKFAALIGKKDPVSTLATLILLSYAKLLSVTITALSFVTLDYPDNKQVTVWLPDGNVKYFEGKIILLLLVALLIILIGLPCTILLFLWQWIVRAPRWKVFKWTRNIKLNAFITAYHVPHNSKYRYWTGLLLLVRVVLYVTASVTVSANPQTFPLISIILIGSLLLFKGVFGIRVYKNSLVDTVDTVLYFNLLALAAFTLYDFKGDLTKQKAVAYISTIVTFILFIGSICYHIKLLLRKEKPPQDLNDHPLEPADTEMTYSVIDLPERDQDSPPDKERETEMTEIFDTVTSSNT